VPDHPRARREFSSSGSARHLLKLVERNRGAPFGSWTGRSARTTHGRPPRVGRTLKDVFSATRPSADSTSGTKTASTAGLHGSRVEKSLGLTRSAEIEDTAGRVRGSLQGARCPLLRCDRRAVQALGMWMDWDNSTTPSATRTRVHLALLKECMARLAVQGASLDAMCRAAGRPLQARAGRRGNYVELKHPSLFVRFPLKGRDDESLSSGRRRRGRSRERGRAVKPARSTAPREASVSRRGEARPGRVRREGSRGNSSSVSSTRALRLPAGARASHRVIRGTEVRSTRERESSTSRGCRAEDLSSRACTTCPSDTTTSRAHAARVRRARG